MHTQIIPVKASPGVANKAPHIIIIMQSNATNNPLIVLYILTI